MVQRLLSLSPMMTTTKLVLLGSMVFAFGCGLKKEDGSADSAESAVDSYDSTNAEGNVMMSAVDGADQGTSLTAATDISVAATIAANVALRWPTNCAVATASGPTVKVIYDNCTGPRGLVHVTGELDLTISVTAGGTIGVHGAATGFQVNGATLDIDTTATYATNGTAHTLTVHTDGSGVGPRGNDVEHTGDYTITWDTGSQCGAIEGSWETDRAASSRSTQVDLSRCASSCPSGTLTHKYIAGASVTVTFDGTAVATWAGSGGLTGSVNLSCTAQ